VERPYAVTDEEFTALQPEDRVLLVAKSYFDADRWFENSKDLGSALSEQILLSKDEFKDAFIKLVNPPQKDFERYAFLARSGNDIRLELTKSGEEHLEKSIESIRSTEVITSIGRAAIQDANQNNLN
jgi:hypothetical protein